MISDNLSANVDAVLKALPVAAQGRTDGHSVVIEKKKFPRVLLIWNHRTASHAQTPSLDSLHSSSEQQKQMREHEVQAFEAVAALTRAGCVVDELTAPFVATSTVSNSTNTTRGGKSLKSGAGGQSTTASSGGGASALSVVKQRWKFPKRYDFVVVDFELFGEFSGLFVAQEIRRWEREGSFLSEASVPALTETVRRALSSAFPGSDGSALDVGDTEGLGGEKDSCEAVKYVALRRAQLMQRLEQLHSKTVIYGMFRKLERRNLMERTGVFDEVLRHPIDIHVDYFAQKHVMRYDPQRLMHAPSHTEVLHRLSEFATERWSVPDHIARLLTANQQKTKHQQQQLHYGGVGAATQPGGSTAYELEYKVKQLEDEMRKTTDAWREAEKETDVANLHAQEAHKMVSDLELQLLSSRGTVTALERILEARTKELEAERRLTRSLVSARSPLKEPSQNNSGLPTSPLNVSAMEKALTREEQRQQGQQQKQQEQQEQQELDLEQMVEDNHQLRDEMFEQMTEVHILKGEYATLQAHHSKIAEELEQAKLDIQRHTRSKHPPQERPDGAAELKLVASPRSGGTVSFPAEKKNTPAPTATRELPGARLRRAVSSVIARRASFVKKAQSNSDQQRHGSMLAGLGFGSGIFGMQVPMIGGSDDDSDASRWGNPLQESLENQMMEIHDSLSQNTVHLNFVRCGILSERQRETLKRFVEWERVVQKKRSIEEQRKANAEGSALSSQLLNFSPQSGSEGLVNNNGGGSSNEMSNSDVSLRRLDYLSRQWVDEEARDAIHSQWAMLQEVLQKLESAVNQRMQMTSNELVDEHANQQAAMRRRRSQVMVREMESAFNPAMSRREQQRLSRLTEEEQRQKQMRALLSHVFEPFKKVTDGVARESQRVVSDCAIDLLKMFDNEAKTLQVLSQLQKIQQRQELGQNETTQEMPGGDDASGVDDASFGSASHHANLGSSGSSSTGTAKKRKTHAVPSPPGAVDAKAKQLQQRQRTARTHPHEQHGRPLDGGGEEEEEETQTQQQPLALHLEHHQVIKHVSKHFHHIIRKALIAILNVYQSQQSDFLKATQSGFDALQRIVRPLQQLVALAEQQGKLRPRADFATQTEHSSVLHYHQHGQHHHNTSTGVAQVGRYPSDLYRRHPLSGSSNSASAVLSSNGSSNHNSSGTCAGGSSSLNTSAMSSSLQHNTTFVFPQEGGDEKEGEVKPS